MEIKFKVKSSSGAGSYTVKFIKRDDNNLSAYCDCPAGDNGQACKHRLAILNGDSSGLVSKNRDDIKIVREWLKDSDIEKHLSILEQLESEAEKIKKAISTAKKELAKAMRD